MKKRVAAYCRVSTDSSDQANSLFNQEQYFKNYIEKNPQWELVKIYRDLGASGTSTRKRMEFNQMIGDAFAGKLDLILTKEISRFARNTLDSIYYTRRLKEQGIGVLFMNDNINTLDADAELRLTIMSSIAQEESRKTSERVKWGQKRKMEQGVVFGGDLLGYDVKNGKMTINKEGAEIVQLIFSKFINEGKGTSIIARELQEGGIGTSVKEHGWSNTSVLRILQNEKMCGDLIQKKTYTPNYMNHEKKYNHGEEELIILKNHHEAIISRTMFGKVQQELKRRRDLKGDGAKYSNRYCFSGKIKCDVCNSTFVARSNGKKKQERSWQCYRRVKEGKLHKNANQMEVGCDSASIKEETLKVLLQENMALLHMEDRVIETRFNEINEVLKKEGLPIEQKKQEEIRLFIKGILLGEVWNDSFYRHIIRKIVIKRDGTLNVSLCEGLPEWQTGVAQSG
ncbi:MAG: recombinase family protein [Lachnospiraceae bacterium]